MSFVQCDLADLTAVSELAQAHIDCDVAVFLAALAEPSRLENIDVSQLERTLAVGELSNYILIRAIGPAVAQRR